jgi:hypothetical protein
MTAEQKQKNREDKKARVAYYRGLDEQRRAAERAAQAEQRLIDASNRSTLILTSKERKLLTLMLNPESPENEWHLALTRFGESLRARNLRID